MDATPGWNDPPNYVGPPTGNLKINLNKRVPFPLETDAVAQASGSSPGLPLLPPRPPPAFCDPIDPESKSGMCNEADLDSKKDKVLTTLLHGVEDLSSAVQSSVSLKLTTLEDDWNQSDVEMKKLLVELTDYLDNKDSKGASATQRKIVMKGCAKPWLINYIRQIVTHLETKYAEEASMVQPVDDDSMPLDLSKKSPY